MLRPKAWTGLRYFGLLMGCCLLTHRATAWLMGQEMGRMAEFAVCEGPMTEFVHDVGLHEGQELSGEEVPTRLRRAGIVQVSRERRFVFFTLSNAGRWHDDPMHQFVWQLDREGRAINELMTRHGGQFGEAYHIQYLSLPGWYYWCRH